MKDSSRLKRIYNTLFLETTLCAKWHHVVIMEPPRNQSSSTTPLYANKLLDRQIVSDIENYELLRMIPDGGEGTFISPPPKSMSSSLITTTSFSMGV